MKRFLIAASLLAVAAAANAALVLRPRTSVEMPLGEVNLELGPHRLTVPRALMRDPGQMSGMRLDRLDLVMLPESFAPLPPVDALAPEKAPPERIAMIITPEDDRLSSIDMFGRIYARFLVPDSPAGPAGLMLRRFRENTPYADRALYLGVGTGRTFVALCPLLEAQGKEPCTTTFRLAGLDMELRFQASQLPQWRRITERAFALLEDMVQESPGSHRVALPPER